jgi:arabinogalactan oligomer/maltooligosaccharide transport system substrate-binding protein
MKPSFALLALIVCMGCDSKSKREVPKAAEPPAPAVEVLLWHSYRGAEKEAIEQVIASFNKAGGPTSLKALAVPFDALNDKITAAVPRGHGPDLFIFAHNMVGPWTESGVVEPISAWAEEGLLDDFLDLTVKSLVYKGNLYGLPLAFKSLALFANKALAPEMPTSLDDLVAKAKAARNKATGVYGLVYDAMKLYNNAPWLHAFGARIVDDTGMPAFDSAEGAAAVSFARDLMKVHDVIPEESTTYLATTLFNTGKAAYMLSGPWFLAERAEGLDLAVAPLPTRGERHAAPLMGAEAVMLSAKSKSKEAAFKAMRYLVSDDAARIRWKVARQTVANKAVYEDADVKADPITSAFRAQLEHTVPMDNSPRMQAIWSEADRALHRAIKGGIDPKVALGEAATKIRSDLERAGR